MSGNKAPTLETKAFRLEHSGKALESKDSFLSFLAPSNSPNQLWSSCPGVNGEWLINRGTGVYLVVDSSTVAVKIELPYEWNIEKDGFSVRLEADLASQKMLLQNSQQQLTLSPHRDVDSCLAVTYVAQPSLSVGSENYLESPEHICITNHVFNTVDALNAIIHILEHPDSALPVDSMAVLFRDHIKQFSARGEEASQNLQFAKETVASWFTAIGAKMDAEVNKKGSIEGLTQNENPGLKAAEQQQVELKKTHVKTESDLTAREEKFKMAEDDYKSAEAYFKKVLANEELAKRRYNDSPEDLIEYFDGAVVPLNNFVLQAALSTAKSERLGAETKKDSKESELYHEQVLLNTLKDQSARELTGIAKFEADIKKAKSAAEDAASKATEYQKHHQTLTTLHVYSKIAEGI